jgi:hypothetical protein
MVKAMLLRDQRSVAALGENEGMTYGILVEKANMTVNRRLIGMRVS